MKASMIALIIGFILDLMFGDPYKMPHLVRLMGKTVGTLERILRKAFSGMERFAGFLLVMIMLFLYGAVPCFLIRLIYHISVVAGICVESFICYQMLAAKSLKKESMKVCYSLKEKDLEGARKNVSMIVGRDTKNLDEQGIIRAAVETVAENTSDGVIAPLFYMTIGGGWLGMAYKAVNTMDSMIGYRNEKYIRFGFFAARLDDLVNYIPARLSALFMILAAFLLKMDGKNAIRIFRRDRYNHKSPNSAQTEAVCAGALDIRLGGNAYYFGKLYEKPYIGEAKREIENQDIVRANQLMYGTTFLVFGVFVGVRMALHI